MKLSFLTLVFVGLTLTVAAQQIEKVYLLKNDGKEVQTKDEADFIRIIQPLDSTKMRFEFKELYKNGNPKTLGYLSAYEPELKFVGWITRLDSNGKRQEVKNYQDGEPVGISTDYYSNGKVKRKTEFPGSKDAKTLIENNISDFSDDFPMEKRMFEADSTGKVFVENGNGHFREVIDSGEEEKIEEGNYINGYKNGTWTGFYPNRHESFVETYVNGKMLGGETTKDGEKFKYKVIRKKPEFRGGIAAWYRYISKNTRYPVDATGNRIKGVVKTRYLIAGDGKISDVEIDESKNRTLDLEASRILYKSPRWRPAQFRGIPFNYAYNQKFDFRP
ncbi:antitoxin component YwqK of YwqJK toxin-antitoxin module [Pedobacter sp. UYEF25]